MRILMMVVLGVALAGCGETAKRTVYETLRESEHQRCLQQGTMNCSQAGNYDDYQRQRKELEQSR